MNTRTIAILAVAAVISGGLALRASMATPAAASAGDRPNAEQLRRARVTRGEYIVNTAACHDCHTPWQLGPNGPEPDMTRMLSGHPAGMQLPPAPPAVGPWITSAAASMTAWSGPWGTSFTANLTPDRETGLGSWTEDHFVQTIRTGRHMGSGRPLLPPMPVPVYRNFTDEDLKAIYWYLQSIPAIKNRVPQPLPPEGAQL
jgi:mono/diheme cytochrome c family protein